MSATNSQSARNRSIALWFLALVVTTGLGCISMGFTLEYQEDGSGVAHLAMMLGNMDKAEKKDIESLRSWLTSAGWQNIRIQPEGQNTARLTADCPFAVGKVPESMKQLFPDMRFSIDTDSDGSKVYTWEASYDLRKGKEGWNKSKEAGPAQGDTPKEGSADKDAFGEALTDAMGQALKNAPKGNLTVDVKLPGHAPVECCDLFENHDAYMDGKEDVAKWVWGEEKKTPDSGKLVVKRKGGQGVEVLDANPTFNGDFDYTDIWNNTGADRDRRAADAAAANTTKREGAVADGASLLVLRMPVPGPGKCDYTIEGEESAGGLFPLESDPFGEETHPKVTVDAVATGTNDPKRWWALALYVPPTSFPSGSRGARHVLLKMHFKPEEQGKPDMTAGGSFRLIRPPVVLVHGTFDKPDDCWSTPSPHSSETMEMRLVHETLRVFKVDWEATNGKTDPSRFSDNLLTVWRNPGGIKDAIEALRKEGFAATQADLVCHSQGGVIARMYARGAASAPRPDGCAHFTNPRACAQDGACHYHRKDNFARGDIHRLITISTTHMGSDNCRALYTYQQLKDSGTEVGITDEVMANLLLLGAGFQGNSLREWPLEVWKRSGPFLSGGYLDQIPGSRAYMNLGKTMIPCHAIACTCEDEDMNDFNGLYVGRYKMVWGLSPRNLLVTAWEKMGQPEDAADLGRRSDEEVKEKERVDKLAFLSTCGDPGSREREQAIADYNLAKDTLDKIRIANACRVRAAMFGNCPNDSTVREESSKGGLPDQYTTTIPHVLHGYAPSYSSVQERVVQLLLNDGSLLCKEGFPPSKLPANRPYTGPGAPAGGASPPAGGGSAAKKAAPEPPGLQDAAKLYQAGDYADALEKANAALKAQPDSVDALTLAAGLELLAGDPKKGLAEADALLQRAPNDASALTLRGQAALWNGDTDGAAKWFQRSAAAAPGAAKEHYQRGGKLLDAGTPLAAVLELTTAAWQDPKLNGAYFGLGMAYSKLGANDRAIQAFERYLKSDSTSDFADRARKEIDRLRARTK